MGIIVSQKYRDERLGTVHIRVLSTATRFTARWKADGLHITVPSNTTIEEYKRVVESWIPKLLQVKPDAKGAQFHDGYRFETDDWGYEIVKSARVPHGYVYSEQIDPRDNSDRKILQVKVYEGADFANAGVEKAIKSHIARFAKYIAATQLIPQAREEAAALGLSGKVKSWSVGRGHARMGCCKATGDISLSYVLVFLPRELRRCTITHELAHLTHFDHSPAFHALWTKYLGPDSERLIAQARTEVKKYV